MKDKGNYIMLFLISLMMSFSFNLQGLINYKDNIPDYFINHFHFDLFFFLKVILIAFPCYLVIQIICKLLDHIKAKKMIMPYSKKTIIITSFSIIFITSLIFLLVYYPGSGINDTIGIIQYPVGMSSQHPIIYNLWLSLTYRFFHFIFHNANISFFLTSLIQIIIIDIIITYLIWWFHKTFKTKIGTFLLIIYFSLTPIIANYNSVLIKDSLFSAILLLHIPLIYEMINTNGECLKKISYIIKLIIILLFTAYIRNNGIYIVILTMIILLLCYEKYLKQLGISLISIIILSQLPNIFITKPEALFQEKIAIPLQQISYVITNNEQSISAKDRNYLNKIINFDTVKEYYNPYSVDPIKWNPKFNRKYLNKTKQKFIITWSHLLISNLENYIKSYSLQTYELWSIEKFNYVQSRFLGLNFNDIEFNHNLKKLHNKNIFPNKVQNKLEHFYEKTTIYFGNGTCFWFLMIFICFCIYKRKYKLLPLYIAPLGIWITLMISAPISYAFRYLSSYAYLLPFIILITLASKEKEV